MNASIGRTWDAVIDMFAVRNIPIRTIERVSGLIATDQLSVGDDGGKWADCGKLNATRLVPHRAIYNVLVRGDSVASTVKATVRWAGYATIKEEHSECSTSHVWERGFEGEVKDRAEAVKVNTKLGIAVRSPAETKAESDPPPAPHAASSLSPSSATRKPTAAHPEPTAQSTPAVGPNITRSNSELLATPQFRITMGDASRLGLLTGYKEVDTDSLEVSLSDFAMTATSTEYYLRRLLTAYKATTAYSSRSVLLLRHAGQSVGEYTDAGLNRGDWR